jgi:hypothetical protein
MNTPKYKGKPLNKCTSHEKSEWILHLLNNSKETVRTPEETEQAIFKNKAKLRVRETHLHKDDKDMEDIFGTTLCNEHHYGKLHDDPKKPFFTRLLNMLKQLRP